MFRGFWNFARNLAFAHGCSDADPYNLVWSNLFKIGAPRGNPTGRVAKLQKELAVRTLRAEITTYKPTIVVFATLGYNEAVVYEACGIEHKHKWVSIDEGLQQESWSLQVEGAPAILWIAHPAFKFASVKSEWISRARNLGTLTTPIA